MTDPIKQAAEAISDTADIELDFTSINNLEETATAALNAVGYFDLAEKVKRYEEALEFYADEENWIIPDTHDPASSITRDVILVSKISVQGASVARKALSEE